MDKVIKQGLQFDAGFDPKSADKMRKTVENIIASASNINFDTPENKKSLQALISVFRDMFESVGNKKIDFTKMLNMPGPEMFDAFKNSANEMADVWADVVSRMGTNGLRNVFMKDERSIKDTFERLKQNRKSMERQLTELSRAFKDVRGTDVNQLLDEALKEELSFSTAETWEERTAAILRYVKVRDKLLNVTASSDFDINAVDRHQMDFFKDITNAEHRLGAYFVRDLKEVIPEMQTSLNNIFNLYKGLEIEVVPRVVQPLSVRDLLGTKQNSIEVPVELKIKLDEYHSAFQSSNKELKDKLESEISSMFPEEIRDDIISRLWDFGRLENVGDRNYNAIWKYFVKNGMSVGDDEGGFGTGTGTVAGSGTGDASSAEIESLRQQLEDAEKQAEMYRSAMDSMQEEMDGLRGQLADADVENNQKKIETYNELSDAVSRYIELAKSLVSTENNTKEHQQISADMDRFSWNNMPDDEQGYIEAINKQKKNIDKIKKAIKIGASTYTDEDGYEYRVVDDTLAEAESKLRSYIYHYASEFDNIGALVDGAKTKDLKNVITKEVDKFKADETIQRQQEEIAEAANVAAVKEMEQIEEIIKRSAPIDKADKISDTLNELQLGASRVDRFTQSVKTDSLANDMGILSPHKEIENNAKAIKSYEELCGVIERYNELVKKRYIFTGGEEPTLTADEENEYAELYGRLNATREGVNINKLTGFDGITDIEKLAQLLGIQIPQAAQQAKQSVSGLNNELQATGDKVNNVDGKLGDSVSTGASQTSGATAEEVENLEKVRAKVAEITTAVEAKTTAFQNEKTTVGTVVDEEVKKLGELEEKVKSITNTISGLLNNIKNGESNLGEALNNVVVNVNYPKTEGDEQNKTSVEGLKTMLQDITYKVKLSKSDTDKNANKIALDESVLDKTLRKVFVNILSAKEPTEQTRENYALDSTLKVVNGTLETISGYTNSISSRVSQNTGGATHEFKSKVISIESVLKAIRDKMPKGVKIPSVTNKQTGSKSSSTAFSIDKKETQKLALKKFRTELETTGRLTDDLKKKIRGLAISLGMVKDKEGFARWNEKFKQQKLSVGIDDLNAKEGRIYDAQAEAEVVKELIGLYEELGRAQARGDKNESSHLRGEIGAKRSGLTSVDYATDMKFKHAKDKGFNAASTKAENSALAEQAVTVKRLNALYQQYGILVERAAFAEGYLKDELESQKKAKNDEILALSNSLDVITPEMLAGFDASFARGKKIESDKQYSALAKKMDADEETRLKNIAKLKKEIAILRADSDSATNDGVRNALNEEIKLREELIELQKQDLAMEAQDEAYYRKKLANDTKLAKSNAAASLKERRRVLNESEKEDEKIWKQQVKDIQREHGVNAADSMYKSANDSVIKTVGTKGVSEDIQAKAKELLEQNKELRKLRNEIAEKGNEAEQKDRDALSGQINKVKKLKTEVDGYLKIHEKYSGDNATQFDDVDTSGFGAVGSDQYWKNITTAIKGVTTGKTTIKGLNADTGELTGTTKIAAHTFEEWSATVDPVTGKLSMLRTGIKKTETFIESVTRKTKEIFSYFSGSSIIFKAVNELKKGVQYVRDIDLALTELKKVTDETEETYDRFLETAAKTGERLGSTISAVTEATATFAKLGYSMEQATEMAEAAIVYKNVGDNIASTEDAADSIISTMKGFKLEATESMRIVDSFNEVGNRFAITSQGIGEALRLSASALSEGGNSLDESIGLITAANEVVNDPSSVGTALKTLTLRLRGSKTELEEMGEDVSDMATTTSALQAKLLALTGGQVDIMLDENTFKNSTQILREMADAWEDMTDIQRASALELMGGKRQANVLSALIQNFDTVEKVIETSADSAGSALKENERYLDSIQGKIDQFTNATQTMWNNFLDSDVIKHIVEIGTWLIKLIDGVELFGVKISGLVPTIVTVVAIIAKIKYKLTWSELFAGVGEGITKLNTKLTGLASRLGVLGTTATTTSTSMRSVTVEMLKQQMATSGVSAETQKLIMSKLGLTNAEATQLIGSKALVLSTLQEAVANKTLSATQAISMMQKLGLINITKGLNVANASNIMQLMGLNRQQRLSMISTLGLTMQTKKLTKEEIMNAIAKAGITDAAKQEQLANLMLLASQGKLRASIKLLGLQIKDFLAKNALLLAITAAIAAIALVIKGVDKLIDTSEELKEKLSESRNELEATKSELKDLRSELDEVNKAIQNLQTQGTLSFTDQEELNRLRNQRRELESTIALKSQLETAQQKQVNQDASKAYDSYKTTNFKNGKDKGQYVETGGKVGAGVGGVIGAVALGGTITAGVAAAGAKIGGVVGTALGGPIGTIIGIGLGALAGAIVGGVIGAAGGAVTSEAGKDVEEQLDTMKAERDKLEKARNDAYRAYVADPEDKKLLKKYEKAEEKLTEYDTKMADHVVEIQQMRSQMDWATATPSQRETIEEMDDFIDRYNIIMKSQGAVGNAIERILGYDKYDGISERIEELVEKYKETEDETILTQISAEAQKAQKDLADVSLSAQDVVDYYTLEKGLFDTSTIEGVTNQYLKGIKIMQELADNTKPIEIKIDNKIEKFTFDDLFEEDESGRFKAREKEFSEMLKGMDEKAQNTFKRFAEAVKNNELTWSQAMEAMKHSANLAGYEFIGQQIAEANAEIFKGIKDDISGTIDTFKEFSSALEDVASSMDLLYKAETQMNTAGRLSVKTALEIIESTDDWEKVLDITNGTITLQEGATETLIQSKLDLIGANLENERQQLEEQKSTILAQGASNDFATTIEESTNLAIRNMAGSMAYLTTMMEAYTRAANGEKINTEDFIAKAEKAKLEAIDGAKGELDWKKNSAEAIGLETINERLADNAARQKMYNQMKTGSDYKNNYDFDKTPGDKYDEDEDSKTAEKMDAFQKEMDYWENRIAANQAKYEQLQNEIDLLEAKGQKADASFYEEQIKLENQRLFLLGEQKKAAQTYLATLEEGSEQWWEIANVLNDLESDIDDVTASILDLQDAIAEIDTYKFEEFNTRLDNLISKLDTLRNLIAPDGEEDWFDDEGAWTEAGVAVLGSQLQALEMYKQSYQETMDELAKYEPDYESNKEYYEALGIHSEQEWYDKTEELISQQYDFAESISDTEQSVIDMYESSIDAIEEYTETLIDSYNDYIDSVKEALDAERDLYNFKKNVQKQTKDIAALERRIASLSGSTNASDIAERRRLEADLYGAREELDDTYYEHARDAQSEALDREAEAYEESMTNMIEGLRTSLEEATLNMDEFLMGVTSMVMYNADTVLSKYEETNLPLTTELTNPWIKAKEAVGAYSGDALALMNKWTEKGGFFAQFNASGTTNLQSPWSAGTTAANSFKNSVSTVMSGVVSNISSNVRTASGELSKLYQQIQDTEKRASDANVVVSGSGSSGGSGGYVAPQKKYYVNAFLDMGGRSLSVTKSGSTATEAMSAAKIAILGEYEKVKGNSASAESSWLRSWKNKVKYTTEHYAKGTAGTVRDGFAITDEPQFGDELVLVPGKDGNLSFMRKGTGVVPADMTQKLFELAQIPTSDLMSKNLTAIVPNITKNDFKNEFNFESLVHVDTVDSDTLPKLEKMVDKKIDDFSRALNYSLKKFSR